MPKIERRHEREKEKRRTRRRRDSSYDDYEEEGGISGWKLGLVIGVIVVCFAMLYPTLFHPMLMGFLGRNTQPSPSINQQRPPIHPAMGGGGSRHPGGGHPSRPDVHPAMRMAQAQAEGQSGGSKGMFTWMLPIYTIGVVLFLLYTLFKTKGKKSKKKKRHDYLDSEDDEDEESDTETKFGGKFGKKKLRGLQERLRQTEDAMAKILEQLETVQSGANPVDLDAAEQIADDLEDDMSARKEIGLTETNEQYIKDLETALKDFQSLSKAYDKEKSRKLRRGESTSDEEEEEEEEDSSELSEIEEEVPVVVEKKKKKSKVVKRQKSTSEEEFEKEEEERAAEDVEEEEGIDIDTEIREQEEKRKQEKQEKTVRRRRAKKT